METLPSIFIFWKNTVTRKGVEKPSFKGREAAASYLSSSNLSRVTSKRD
jgi:hypothetical protein